MKKIKLIFNPASDRGRSGQKASDLQALVEQHGGADWAGTKYPGHAVEIAAHAGRQGYDTVVALGGDGTVHEVVNGLMQLPIDQRPALGVVPIGSGNDFAFSSGLEMDAQRAMIRIFAGEASPIDIGLITDGSGRAEYFDNSAGFLLDAAVNLESRKITRLYGFLMYLVAAIRSIINHYETTTIKFNIDGKESTRGLLMFTVGNGHREGGGFQVTPSAKNNDGIFDYLMLDPISRPMMFRVLPEVMAGTHERHSFVETSTFKKMNFEADRAMPIHLDGEVWAPYEANIRKISVEIIPSAVRLVR